MQIVAVQDVNQIGQGVQFTLVVRTVDFNHKRVSEDIEYLQQVRRGDHLVAIAVWVPWRLNLCQAQRAQGNEYGGESEFHSDSFLAVILLVSAFGIGCSRRGWTQQ